VIDLLRRNRDFRALFSAQVISFMGDWFATVALLGLVLEVTHSDVAASAIFISQTLPSFLATPLAGPAADRFDRRRLMVLVSSVQVVAAATFLLVGAGRVWLAFVAQGSIAFLGAFFAPASGASVPNLVEPEDLPTATAIMSSTWGAMLAIGSGLGGVFTVAFGRKAAFVADALTFIVAAILIASIRRPLSAASSDNTRAESRRERMRPLRDTAEAVRHARAHPTVAALLMSKMGFGLGGAIAGLLPILATRRFGAGDGGIGALLAARGVGVVAGPWLARRFTASVERILVTCGVASLVYGLCYLFVPSTPVLAAAAILVFLAHLGGGAQWTLSTYGLQVTTPDALRGRILAADFALVTFTLTLSYFLSGTASTRFGPEPVMRTLALVSLAWGTAYLLLTRRIRQEAGVGGIGGVPRSEAR
jgi:MFS family permease